MTSTPSKHVSVRIPARLQGDIQSVIDGRLSFALTVDEFLREWVLIVFLGLSGLYGPPSPLDERTAAALEKIERERRDPRNRARWRRELGYDFGKARPKAPVGQTVDCHVPRALAEAVDAYRKRHQTLTKGRVDFIVQCAEFGLEVLKRQPFRNEDGTYHRYDASG